jgi:two-component system NarL family sensor kinase
MGSPRSTDVVADERRRAGCPTHRATDREDVPGNPGQTPGHRAPQDERVTTRAAAAFGLFAVVVAEIVAVAVGWVATGMSVATGVDGFMIPNAIIALCCGLCGGLIAVHRPDNRLGWLLPGAGICQAATAAVTPYLALDWAGGGVLELVSAAVLSATYLAALVVLVLRYRRGTEQVRRQLLWLLLATAAAVALIVVTRLAGPVEQNGFPVILFTAVALVPAAMAIAVLRHQLFDIRLVWSRALTYAVLTAAVAGAYLVLVEVGGRLLGFGTSVLATLLVAVMFNPARVRVQHAVDRLLYGERADPVRAATTVSARLAGQPADVLPALCQALRLPYARLGEHEYGVRPHLVETVALHEGELEVGVRAGQRRLHTADRAVLDLLAVPITVALRAEALSAAVQASRRAIVEGREEERRRLRRDLHDGLGPVLTGIAFQADAVVNLAASDPAEVRALGTEIRAAVGDALADVRHLIYQLRPAALDEWGLVEAVRKHAQRLAPLHTRITAGELPTLPAAVEVAAYRIVTEALTNVARHSTAGCAEVVIAPDDAALRLTIRDDGAGSLAPWRPGVGLRSLRERAAELGGCLEAAPTPAAARSRRGCR